MEVLFSLQPGCNPAAVKASKQCWEPGVPLYEIAENLALGMVPPA